LYSYVYKHLNVVVLEAYFNSICVAALDGFHLDIYIGIQKSPH